jgi:hypothetical protein
VGVGEWVLLSSRWLVRRCSAQSELKVLYFMIWGPRPSRLGLAVRVADPRREGRVRRISPQRFVRGPRGVELRASVASALGSPIVARPGWARWAQASGAHAARPRTVPL